jgi:hypothetical protein
MGAMPSQVKYLHVHSDTGGAGKAIPYLSLESTAKNLKPQRARRTSAEDAEKKLMTAKGKEGFSLRARQDAHQIHSPCDSCPAYGTRISRENFSREQRH